MIVYVLVDPRNPYIVRYVGKTTLSAEKRPAVHLAPSTLKKHRHCTAWILGLLSEGVRPAISTVYRASTIEETNSKEVELIAFYRAEGHDLTNHALGGGSGALGCKRSEVFKERCRQRKKGVPLPQETRDKISKTLMGRLQGPNSDETRYKKSRAKGGRPFCDETGRVFQTLPEAAKFWRLDSRNLSSSMKHGWKCGGHTFRYFADPARHPLPPPSGSAGAGR